MRKVQRILFAAIALAALLSLGACDLLTAKSTTPAATITPDVATVYGTVGGYVTDVAGQPLAGVKVSANSGSSSKDIFLILTDANGWFEIKNLISGDHTLIIGSPTGNTPTTQLSYKVHVMTIDELRDAVQLPSSAQIEGSATVVSNTTTLVNSFDGNYFVNVSINGTSSADVFVVYPLTASISGVAMIKTSSLDPNSKAVAADTNYRIYADFSAFNPAGPLSFIAQISAVTGAFTIEHVPAVGVITTSTPINLALDRDSVIADPTSDINSDVQPEGITDGVLFGTETRNIGTIYFIASIAPTITTFSPEPNSYSGAKFDPGTALARTPLVFTFSKAMNPGLGTLTVKDSSAGGNEDYIFAGVWSAGNTVYTVTPSEMFQYGETITATFTGFESADGVPFAGGPYSFVVRDALKLLSATTWTAYGSGVNTVIFPVANDVVLTFNSALSDYVPALTYISKSTGEIVPAAASITGSTLTINPTASLEYNTSYLVKYKVTGALFETVDTLSDATGTVCGFTTAKQVLSFTAPTLALDVAKTYTIIGSTRTTFEHGDSTFYVRLGKVTGADSYYLEWKDTAKTAWTRLATALSPLTETSSEFIFYIQMANLIAGSGDYAESLTSGESFDFRIFATTTDGRASVASNLITMKDETAPTAANGITLSNITANNVGGVSNPSTTNFAYLKRQFILSNSEPLYMPTSADVTFTGTNSTYASLSYIGFVVGSNNTTIEVEVRITANQTIAGAFMNLVIHDAANNLYNNGTPATYQYSF